MNGTLECDISIYQQPYFVFDPESIQRNQANVLQRLQFTSGSMVTNRAGNIIEVFSTDPSSLFNAVFWSSLVVFLTVCLLAITCCCQCCIGCYCVNHKDKKSTSLKVCCGMLSSVLAILVMVGCGVLLWSETTLDTGAVSHYNQTMQYVRGTLTDTGHIVLVEGSIQLFYSYQLYRHWISIGFLCVSIIVMLITFFAVCFCAPARKSLSPIVTMLIITFLVTLTASGLAAATFLSLFYVSYVCYDLYRIGGTFRCSDPSLTDISLSLQLFCGTDVVIPHTITVGVYFLLLIVLVIWQIVASMYAGTFSGSENSRDHDRQDHITQYESDDVAEHQAVTTTTTYHSQQAVMASRLPSPTSSPPSTFQSQPYYGQLRPYRPPDQIQQYHGRRTSDQQQVYHGSPSQLQAYNGSPDQLQPYNGRRPSDQLQPYYRQESQQAIQEDYEVDWNSSTAQQQFRAGIGQQLDPSAPPPPYHELENFSEHEESHYRHATNEVQTTFLAEDDFM